MVRKAPTAYFVFSAEQREDATAQWRQENPDKAKINVAGIAKILGEKWKALTDEQRQSYKDRALQVSTIDLDYHLGVLTDLAFMVLCCITPSCPCFPPSGCQDDRRRGTY